MPAKKNLQKIKDIPLAPQNLDVLKSQANLLYCSDVYRLPLLIPHMCCTSS